MFAALQSVLDKVFGTAWHTNAGNLGAKSYAGDPTNNLAPDFAGQFCVDTTNAALYWASTGLAAGWKKLTP